jgi:RNA polymerase sigma factor (sigma-70 family)
MLVTEQPSGAQDPDDATLLNMVRVGDTEAFEVLYQRHEQAARRLARDLVVSPAEVHDVVAETFAVVLDVTRRGGGPTDAFRPYVLTALRRVCYDRLSGQQAQLPTDERPMPDLGEPFIEPGMTSQDRPLIVRAFLSLPERWRAVLWHTEIEQESPAEVAPLLGLTDSGVAALRRRAIDGMRQAYLLTHISRITRLDCKPVAERLGAFVRDALSVRDTSIVKEHLSHCAECKAVSAELTDVDVALRDLVAPVFLGSAAASYMSGTWRADAAGASAAAAAGAQPAATPHAAAIAAGAALNTAGRLRSPDRVSHASQLQRWLAVGSGAALVVVAFAVAVTLTGYSTPLRPGAHQLAGAADHRPAASEQTSTLIPASATSSSASGSGRKHHPAASPAASISPSPGLSQPASSSPLPAVQLAAAINVYAPWSHGNFAQVVFEVTDTGTTATGELTASISLPSGASLLWGGHGRHGGQSGWTCQADDSGATCQYDSISAGSQAPGFLVIAIAGSAACGQPVQLAVSSGNASASAQSPEDIQCSSGNPGP